MHSNPAAWWDAALSGLGGARRVADCCFGEPRRVGDVSIIPVATLEVGGGGVPGPAPGYPPQVAYPPQVGAAAFGARLVPAAVLVIRGREVEALILDPRLQVARRLLDLVEAGRGPLGPAADPAEPPGAQP